MPPKHRCIRMMYFVILYGIVFQHFSHGVPMNVALKKTVFANDYHQSHMPEYAVDGDTTGKYFSVGGRDNWLVVDLEVAYRVNYLRIYLPSNYGPKTLVVGLTNSFDGNENVPKRRKYSLCSSQPANKSKEKNIFMITCDPESFKARYVIIQAPGIYDLILVSELEVYAEEIREDYIGCYQKNKVFPETNDVLSVEECVEICKKKEYYFAIIKNGRECKCTQNLEQNLEASKCSMSCEQDKNPCGDKNFYSAYHTKHPKKTRPRHLGCFKDEHERDFPYQKNFKKKLTVELCLETCLSKKYTYAAVQFGYNCFCGNSYGKYGSTNSCDMSCEGNTTQICGKSYRNNVYEACYTYDKVLDTCSDDPYHCYGGYKPTSYKDCESCERGWKGTACMFRDCEVNNGACGQGKCQTYDSSNVEISDCLCKPGFYKTNYICKDIDECVNTNKCKPEESKCLNTPGSYQCDCLPQYKNSLNSSFECIDRNECEEETHNCTRKNEECVNLQGSFDCQCLSGYHRNGTSCFDTDECLSSPCDDTTHFCENIQGSYSCLLKKKTKTGLIITGIILSVLLLFIFMLILLLWNKRKKIKDSFKERRSKRKVVHDNEVKLESIDNRGKVEQGTRILLSDLEKFYLTKCKTVHDTFVKCPKDCGASKEVASKRELSSKNRFKTIFPYDHNRVILTLKPQDDLSHYINASFISAYETVTDYSYIATQGPKPKTLEDFWRMIVQFSVSVVVMLTKCFEDGLNKCQQYWPDSGSERYGSLLVTLMKVTKTQNLEKRIFKIEDKENGIKVTTHHLLFTAWPDKSVPQNAMNLLNLRSLMLQSLTKSKKKLEQNCFGNKEEQSSFNLSDNSTKYIIVHCSAGVGRTGTFIALDHLINEALHTGSVDIFETMKRLRKQRCLMIQTKTQYELCHKCLHMYYMLGEDTLVRLQDKQAFEKKMIGLRKIVGEVSLIEKQFKIINDETKSNKVKEIDKTTFDMSYGKLEAVHSSSATKHSKYVVGVVPSSFSKQDVFTLFSDRVGILVLIDTKNEAMNNLFDSLQNSSNLKSSETTMKYLGQVTNKVGHIMNFKVESSQLYGNAETVQESDMRKVINVSSLEHEVIKSLFEIVKKEDEDTFVSVLSRNNYDDASLLVAALNVAESIEISRSFDIFQIAFEMRFLQPACLSQIELYKKLYDIAEKLAFDKMAKNYDDNNNDNEDDNDDDDENEYENYDEDKFKNINNTSEKNEKEDEGDVSMYVDMRGQSVSVEENVYANI